MKEALSLALRVFAAILIKPIQKQRNWIEAVSHQGPSMSLFCHEHTANYKAQQ